MSDLPEDVRTALQLAHVSAMTPDQALRLIQSSLAERLAAADVLAEAATFAIHDVDENAIGCGCQFGIGLSRLHYALATYRSIREKGNAEHLD